MFTRGEKDGPANKYELLDMMTGRFLKDGADAGEAGTPDEEGDEVNEIDGDSD